MSLIHIFSLSAIHPSTTLSAFISFLPHTNSFYHPIFSTTLHQNTTHRLLATRSSNMATAISPMTTVAAAVVVGPSRPSMGRATRVKYINGINSFGGLKAHSHVASLGLHAGSEQCFAKIVSSLKQQSSRKSGGGGALTSTCNAVAEIFRIAAIMNGITLVGVAIGFVLLLIEAAVEESLE